jgi:photosystem II stability/assembly factor-like uncharacterized protein
MSRKWTRQQQKAHQITQGTNRSFWQRSQKRGPISHGQEFFTGGNKENEDSGRGMGFQIRRPGSKGQRLRHILLAFHENEVYPNERFPEQPATAADIVMRTSFCRFGVAACCALWTVAYSVSAQNWTNRNLPGSWWNSVSCSADGAKLAVVSGPVSGSPAVVYMSADSGLTWRPGTLTNYSFSCVASSADGTKLAVAGTGAYSDGYIYTSADSGTNWTKTMAPLTNWSCIGSSADGTRLVAGGSPVIGAFGIGSQSAAPLHVSTDSGTNWTAITNLPSGTGAGKPIISAANGTKWAAIGGDAIYTSTNGGTVWRSNNVPFQTYNAVASASADGTKLMAAVFNGGGFFISTDWGSTWASNSSPAWGSPALASSADGTKLVVADSSGYPSGGLIYTSTNGGTTWLTATAGSNFWNAVASSADGSKLVASAEFNGIYTWQSMPSPLLNIAPLNGKLALSWTLPSASFVLQQNSDPTSMNWVTVTNTPTLNLTNLQDQVILSPLPGNRFYRLQAR